MEANSLINFTLKAFNSNVHYESHWLLSFVKNIRKTYIYPHWPTIISLSDLLQFYFGMSNLFHVQTKEFQKAYLLFIIRLNEREHVDRLRFLYKELRLSYLTFLLYYSKQVKNLPMFSGNVDRCKVDRLQ